MSQSTFAQTWSSLAALAVLVLTPVLVLADDPPLAARFATPPAGSRMLKIIHSWPDAPEAQDNLIGRLSKQGFGGVVCNVAFDGYLESAPKWRALERAVAAAKKAGWTLWLYDERGYPSGNAGGIVLRDHPAWEARGLLIADVESASAPVDLESPPGTLMLAAAFPVRDGQIDPTSKQDLSAQLHDGKLHWQPPAGRWRAMIVTESRLYEGTHAEGNLAAKMPYINLLMREPTAAFLHATHDRYAEHFGADLGRTFVSTFTDEPSLMSVFLRPMPYRVLPWSPGLPGAFEKRRGYALAPIVPELIADAGPAGQKHRYDYWQTIGELVSENFFGQIQEWCRPHKILSGGHLLMEEGLVAHVPLYGDFFRCARRLDAPSIDCLTSVPGEVPWYIARLLASAAELEGKQIVMCETSDHAQAYRPAGDARPARVVTEAEIRGTCHRLMVGGVNCITSYYRFTGLSDEQLVRLNEGVGRASTMLTGGHQAADVAVVYPVESLWTRFVPSHHWAKEAQADARIETLYRGALDGLFQNQRDFTIVDGRTLAESQIEADALVHGPLRWRVVVLPGVDTLPRAAWENLARFVKQGGVVVALGALPVNSEAEFPCAQVQALSQDLFGAASNAPLVHAQQTGGAGVFLPSGSAGLLPLVLKGLLDADVDPGDPAAPLRVTHRRIDGHEVYFVINDSAKPWAGSVRFAATGAPERWDLATGRVEPLSPDGPIALSLEPFGATIVRFAEARPPRRHPVSSGSLPNLTTRSLPNVVPTLPHGEFVRADIKTEPVSSNRLPDVWTTRAVLTKGKVDTHLFTNFSYEPAADSSEASCLVLDTTVPDGQRTPNRAPRDPSRRGRWRLPRHHGPVAGRAGPRAQFPPAQPVSARGLVARCRWHARSETHQRRAHRVGRLFWSGERGRRVQRDGAADRGHGFLLVGGDSLICKGLLHHRVTENTEFSQRRNSPCPTLCSP